MDAEAEVFRNDDFSYLGWLTAHPNGWVLNVPQVGSGTIVKHQSRCGTIRGARDWTGGNYYKVVGEVGESLDRWLSINWSGSVRQCGHCGRSDNGTTIVQSGTAAPARPQIRSSKIRSSKVVQISTAPAGWQLWSMGHPVKVLDSIEPRLASWDHSEHPNQLRLNAYLKPVHDEFSPLLVNGGAWAISMVVDVVHERLLSKGHDVENYITPLVKKLGARHFVYAAVAKRVGGGSSISIGPALRRTTVPTWSSWSGRVAGKIGTPDGKRSIRGALCALVDSPLPPGPVAMHLAWRLSASRNWADLWKPTGDTMGPVLGEPRFPKKEFDPHDDRITELSLHRIVDDTLDVVDVGMWWSLPAKS